MGLGIGAASIIGGSSLLSGIIGSSASKSAASTQSSASMYAAQLAYEMYQQTASRLQPWVTTGQAANQQLGGLLGLSGYQASGAGGLGTGALTTMFQPTIAELVNTPGYQFTLNQGLQATQNAAASMGLGTSGSALRGATSYAEGLASTTYQQQFNNYWSQLSNIYNMLSGVSSSGANAAAQTGQAGTSTASTVGNYLTNAATASASGTIGSATSLTNALSNISSIPLQSALIGSLNRTVQSGTGAVGGNTALS